MMKIRKMTSLGGGHGLFQTLRSARVLNVETINAVVTVADDGGSSGRIRRELGQSPPGDLRMALAALTRDEPEGALWEGVLQHRFGGTGALAGHALGNLLLSGLTEFFGNQVAALDFVARTANCQGRVLPVSEQPLDIEADVSGLDDDPRIMLPVRGQVSVATTPGSVRRVRLLPDNPEACRDAVAAILDADVVTLGPGSWFTSVIPNLLVPGIVDALANTSAKKIVVLNLTAEPGETAGFSAERHIHMLSQHAPLLQVDRIIVDAATIPTQRERAQLARAAASLGAEVAFHDVQDGNTHRHDPAKLAAALVSECEKG
ncbi:uridine diphosphate-N-acetylglucosamine-binding protein YvcK [Corynebacterium sp.]|uniref:gluconeogenesis factor YvcK family protein n=1 Tax=Corynebacterium sp. TaxID=1720 RepID=UPI0026DD06E1|nr:uridine diphosphate-N-acetylglucosamine-binding protein YvcK [Corynebacterium sp.]MDO5077491.1 uridine diphosphate-N-acetylglucosamine-binding protein YvcK [Corynebacterium sp.]